MSNGTYFLGITFSAGNFPSGWFYGIDISLAEIVTEYTFGYPFLGNDDFTGNASFALGAGALPPGLTFYAVAVPLSVGAVPNGGSNPISFTIL